MAEIGKWWFVSVVNRTSGTIVRMDIDGVVANTTSSALHAAANRNPLRQHEVFAVRKAMALAFGVLNLYRSVDTVTHTACTD